MRLALAKFKSNADRSTDALMRLKTILASNCNFKFKQYFSRWKEMAKMMEVRDIHEMEDGPVNLECFVLR
jgi:hypothetical protein